MSNEIVKTESVTVSVTPRQAAWIKLADVKTKLETSLQKQELQLQLYLQGESIEVIESHIDSYVKGWKSLQAERLAFTSIVDNKIVQPLMDYEKRSSPATNEGFVKLKQKLLELKLAANEKGGVEKAKKDEQILYIAHIKNQYEIQKAEFLKTAYREISVCYKAALEDPRTKDEIKGEVAKTITEIKFVELVKFPRKHVTNEEATKIYADIPKPSVKELRGTMLTELERTWGNYENDKAANLGTTIEEESQIRLKEIENEFQQSTAINSLMAQGEMNQTATVVGAGKKKVKTVISVVSEDTLVWAIKIMAAFINTPQAHGYLKAKKAGNIKVEQLADALATHVMAGGKKIDGIKYEEKTTL